MRRSTSHFIDPGRLCSLSQVRMACTPGQRGYHLGRSPYVGHQVVVDYRGWYVNDDRDIRLPAAIDFAARRGNMHAVRHFSRRNSTINSSINALTAPEASVPGMSQWSQPCVCEIIDTELPVPPTGNPLFPVLR